MDLVGSNAIVTGGGRGIGNAMLAELLGRGAYVIVLEEGPTYAEAAAAEESSERDGRCGDL